MRKINNSEVKRVCKEFTEIFKNYQTYAMFFPKKDRNKGVYYFFRFEVSAARNYTYVGGDYDVIACVKKPGDKDHNPALQFANPFFAVAFYAATGNFAISLASEYMSFADKIAKKYYNPSTDCYIKNIGVAESARGKGLLRKAIDELCGDSAVYLETHDERNVEIYRHLGFEICEVADFHGAKHFAMRRPAKAENSVK